MVNCGSSVVKEKNIHFGQKIKKERNISTQKVKHDHSVKKLVYDNEKKKTKGEKTKK